jgi:hypothetical protein
MCTIGNHLKLCSCNLSISQIEELDNYWILYQYTKLTSGNAILGMPMLPFWFTLENHKANAEQLVSMLNEQNAFDIQIAFNNNHRLLISLKNELADDGRDNYGFNYKNGKWRYQMYSWIDWINEWKQQQGGEAKI